MMRIVPSTGGGKSGIFTPRPTYAPLPSPAAPPTISPPAVQSVGAAPVTTVAPPPFVPPHVKNQIITTIPVAAPSGGTPQAIVDDKGKVVTFTSVNYQADWQLDPLVFRGAKSEGTGDSNDVPGSRFIESVKSVGGSEDEARDIWKHPRVGNWDEPVTVGGVFDHYTGLTPVEATEAKIANLSPTQWVMVQRLNALHAAYDADAKAKAAAAAETAPKPAPLPSLPIRRLPSPVPAKSNLNTVFLAIGAGIAIYLVSEL